MKGGRRGTGRRPITSCIVVSTMMLQALRCATDLTALRELSSMREREIGGGERGGQAVSASCRARFYLAPNYSLHPVSVISSLSKCRKSRSPQPHNTSGCTLSSIQSTAVIMRSLSVFTKSYDLFKSSVYVCVLVCVRACLCV